MREHTGCFDLIMAEVLIITNSLLAFRSFVGGFRLDRRTCFLFYYWLRHVHRYPGGRGSRRTLGVGGRRAGWRKRWKREG
jgi:hypothetical protein